MPAPRPALPRVARCWLTLALLVLTGCASNSVFIPYTQHAQQIRQAVMLGQYDAEIQRLQASDKSGSNRLLTLLELGRVEMLAHRPQASLDTFTQVMSLWAAQDQRARISLTQTTAEGASLVTNDNAIPYQGRPYERSMAHEYQALNYLALGRLSDAAVEVRRAEFEQRQILLDEQNSVAAAEHQAHQQGFQPGDYTRFFANMNRAAGRVKNAFQNAMAFYLSALIYEAVDQPNDAYVDIEQAFEMWPDNPVLQQDLVRLGSTLGMSDAERLAQHLHLSPPPAEDGSVVVMIEQGWIPERAAFQFPIITQSTINYLAIPYYPGPFPLPQPENLLIDQQQVTALPLVDFEALAAFDLKGQMPALLARQWLRLLTQQKMERELGSNGNPLGALLGGLFSALTDQADLRSWSTLPANSQMTRAWLTPGQHLLSWGNVHVPVVIRSGHTTLVQVVDNGGPLNIMTYNL